MQPYDPKRPLVRIVAGLAGLAVIGWGIPGLRGDLHYSNWFGEPVFAPLALIFGLVTIWGSLFNPKILGKPPSRRKR